MKKIYMICNLRSGKGGVRVHLPEILDAFTAADFEVTIHTTQSRCDATTCVREACNSGLYDYIVCSGGDGTLNETINGCITSCNPLPIGYIPYGSTNDFARGLGIPINSPLEAVDAIIHGEPMQCDVGTLNGTFFTYVAAFGALVDISYDTSQEFKNVLGHTAYVLSAIPKLPKIHGYRLRIESGDEVFEDEYLYGMVTNSTSVAKMLSLSDVKWDDGEFEVTLIRKPNSFTDLVKLSRAFSTVQFGSEKKYLRYFRTKRLKVTCLDEHCCWTVDGEYGGEAKENIVENHCRAFTLLIDPVRRENANHTKGITTIMPPKE